MNIGIGVLPEQIGVRLQRIANLYLGDRPFARKGVILTRGIAKRDAEIIDAVQRAGDGLPRGQPSQSPVTTPRWKAARATSTARPRSPLDRRAAATNAPVEKKRIVPGGQSP